MRPTPPSSPPASRRIAAMAPPRIVFSDIDGTIMHDPSSDHGVALADGELLLTPPSTSGRQGAISRRTIDLVGKLRAQRVRFVIITGARLSTLLMRLPYLPAADAMVCENGGRIFYPGSALQTACPISEDAEWRGLQAAAGRVHQDAVPPEQRHGVLWEWYGKLKAQGWVLDANGYTTNFRVHANKGGKTLEDLHQVITQAPPELACAFNLGAADFYPKTSGKCEAARYLMRRFETEAEHTAFLCDDDNDMELAAVVGKAFLPSLTSESVLAAVKARPQQFVQATLTGTAATEEMLEAVFKWYGMPLDGAVA